MSFTDDLESVIKLCGYLFIKPSVVHAFLVNFLSLSEVSGPKEVTRLRTTCTGTGSSIAPDIFCKVWTIPAFMTFCNERVVIASLNERVAVANALEISHPLTPVYWVGLSFLESVRAVFFGVLLLNLFDAFLLRSTSRMYLVFLSFSFYLDFKSLIWFSIWLAYNIDKI